MSASDFRYSVLALCAVAGIFTGCGGGSGSSLNPSPGARNMSRIRATPLYGVIYSFKGQPYDGSNPTAALVDISGVLFGTTESGGPNYRGTVFSLELSGSKKERVLHSFPQESGDGEFPYASLVPLNGVLYGTTSSGGKDGVGAVFETSTTGQLSILANFTGNNGAVPDARLLRVGNALYGTASEGGFHHGSCQTNGCGTIFKTGTSGTITVLHKFGFSDGGCCPTHGLVNIDNTLYGTANAGGLHNVGTVFNVTTSGVETLLHSFGASGDGADPEASLIALNGMLYGTTLAGGANGLGTVFVISPTGKERVLHNFGASGDGAKPAAPLVAVNGILYGTTTTGGAYCTSIGGCGTVFKITTAGTEAVIYSFKGYPDGESPKAGLIKVNGTLYGTTCCGGADDAGTVFKIVP